MTTDKSVNEKKVNPTHNYGHPRDVLADQGLTREQKIAILREWHYDAVRLQESAAESMTGGEPDRLQAVSNALLELGVSPAVEADPYPQTKLSVFRKFIDRLSHLGR